MIGVQLHVKIKTEKLFDMVLNMYQCKSIFSLNTVEEYGNEDEWQTTIFKRFAARGHKTKKILHRFEEYVEYVLSKK